MRKLPEKKLAETTNTGRPEQQLDQQEHQANPKMAVWMAGFLELLHRLSTKLSSTIAGIRSRNIIIIIILCYWLISERYRV